MKNLKKTALAILLLISLNVFSQVEYNIDKAVEIIGLDTLELPIISRQVTIEATFSNSVDTRQFIFSDGEVSDIYIVNEMSFFSVQDVNAATFCENAKGEIIRTEHNFKTGTIKYDNDSDGIYEKVLYISRN